MSQRLRWGFALSSNTLPLLRRLLNAGLIDRIALPPNGTETDPAWSSRGVAELLSAEWQHSSDRRRWQRTKPGAWILHRHRRRPRA